MVSKLIQQNEDNLLSLPTTLNANYKHTLLYTYYLIALISHAFFFNSFLKQPENNNNQSGTIILAMKFELTDIPATLIVFINLTKTFGLTHSGLHFKERILLMHW